MKTNNDKLNRKYDQHPFVRRLAVLAVCGACLSACAGLRTTAPSVGRLSADYAVTSGAASGVVAFVYGKRTVLEFGSVPFLLSIKDEQGAQVDFERDGRYIRMARRLERFTVNMNGQAVSFEALRVVGASVPVEPARPAAPVVLVAVEPQAPSVDMAAALKQMQQQIQEIKQLLAAQQGRKASAQQYIDLNARLDAIERQLQASVVVLRVNFPSRGMNFKPARNVAQALVPAANAAYRVNLRGYTDSRIAGLDDAAIALGRALAARKYLVDNGVAPDKIFVYSQPEGQFIAPNWTKAGKAQNRRVEIEMIDHRLVAVNSSN